MPVYVHPVSSIRGEPDVYVEALKEATIQLETANDPELRALLKQRHIIAPVPWSRNVAIEALAHCFAVNAETQIQADNQQCCVIL